VIQCAHTSTIHFKSIFSETGKDPSQSSTLKPVVCGSILAKYGNDIWDRWHGFTDHQQEHDQSQKNRRLQVDFVSRLHRQEEAEERDDEDEEAGSDEVDNVEQTASSHVDGERDVGVRFHTARVEFLVTRCRYPIHHPFLHATEKTKSAYTPEANK